MNITKKLMILLLVFTVFIMGSVSALVYMFSHASIKEAAGLELVGCAEITSGLITEDIMKNLADEKGLKTARTALDWIVDSKPIFKDALVVDEHGTILIADKRVLSEGLKEGDKFYIEHDVLTKSAHNSGHHLDTYTDIYKVNGEDRMAGYASIKNEKGDVLAYMVIEFDADIVAERTWDNVAPILSYAWIFPLIAGLIAYYFIKKGVRPITMMTDEVQRIANGDLSFEPTVVDSKDEIGILSKSIKEMANNLSKIIGKVNETGEALASSSSMLYKESKLTLEANRKIADDIQLVAEGANGQFSQTRDSAAAMEEISSQVIQVAKNSDIMKKSTGNTAKSIQRMASSIKQVSDSSENASVLAEDVKNDAVIGKEHVNRSREEMIAISKIMQNAAEVMQHLGKSSKEIGSIVEVIDSIADQTNLLALNAAIEAARAGEHGKGFSVVADEVKNLAERSANATKEIESLINGIQEETKRAVEAIEVGNEKVNEGNRLSQSASEAIEKIVEGVSNISIELSQIKHNANVQVTNSNSIVEDISTLEEQVNQVAKATHEQTIGVNEINTAINKIKDISEKSTEQIDTIANSSKEGSQSVQKIAESAQVLDTFSQELKASIEKFKLKDE